MLVLKCIGKAVLTAAVAWIALAIPAAIVLAMGAPFLLVGVVAWVGMGVFAYDYSKREFDSEKPAMWAVLAFLFGMFAIAALLYCAEHERALRAAGLRAADFALQAPEYAPELVEADAPGGIDRHLRRAA